MSRWIVFFAFIYVRSLTSVARALADSPTEPSLNNPGGRTVRSSGRAHSRISITRLKESRRVRQLYNKALNAWQKRKASEAQQRLEQALELYPEFPEALMFYGGIHAAARQ